MKEKDITQTLQLARNKKKNQSDRGDSEGLMRPIEDMTLLEFVSKSFRHKLWFLFTVVCVMAGAAVAYIHVGSWYSRENTFQFNNFENNALFFIMDSLLPNDGETRRTDNKQEYASRAVSALNSDDFVFFIYDRAKEDPKFAALLKQENIPVKGDLTPAVQDSLRALLDAKLVVSSPEGGGGILKLKNTGFFTADFKGPSRDYMDTFSSRISQYMSLYLSKRELEDVQATRQIVKERLESSQKEIQTLNDTRASLVNMLTPLTPQAYDQILVEVKKAKATMVGNNLMEVRFGELFTDLENKVKALNEGKIAEDETAENLDKELQRTLTRLKEVVQKNNLGVEFDGIKYQENISNDLKFDPKTSSAYYIKQQSAFYQARVKTLESTLKELRDQINHKLLLSSQIDAIDRQISGKEKIASSLEASKIRLDFADFKSLRRVEVFSGPIKYVTIMPIVSYAILITFVSFIIGLVVAFWAEVRNPSLTTVKSFEELNIPVLGAVPSTKTYLIGDKLSYANNDSKALSYVRIAINLTNILTFMHSKIALFTSADTSRQSATITYNLGSYLASTGRKVLLIEADFKNHYLLKLTGVNMDGGLSEVLAHSTEINIKPSTVAEGLDLLSGDISRLPPVYRLASEGFLDLLEELKKNYDYIFIHTCPCVQSPESADLTRYAGVTTICADSKGITLNSLERVMAEMKLFLSKFSYFILENAEDTSSYYAKSSERENGPVLKSKKVSNEIRKAS